MPETFDFLSFPDETILNIMSYLPIVDIINISLANTKFNEICDDEYLWKSLLNRDLGISEKQDSHTWRDTYKHNSILQKLRTMPMPKLPFLTQNQWNVLSAARPVFENCDIAFSILEEEHINQLNNILQEFGGERDFTLGEKFSKHWTIIRLTQITDQMPRHRFFNELLYRSESYVRSVSGAKETTFGLRYLNFWQEYENIHSIIRNLLVQLPINEQMMFIESLTFNSDIPHLYLLTSIIRDIYKHVIFGARGRLIHILPVYDLHTNTIIPLDNRSQMRISHLNEWKDTTQVEFDSFYKTEIKYNIAISIEQNKLSYR